MAQKHTMRALRLLAALLAAAALPVMFGSCALDFIAALLSDTLLSDGTDDKIPVRILLEEDVCGFAALPAAPDYALLTWNIDAHAGTTYEHEVFAEYPDLTIGLSREDTWEFSVTATDSERRDVFYGEAAQAITRGADNTVLIAVTPGSALLSRGEGDCNLAIQTAADTGIAAVYYKLVPAGDTEYKRTDGIKPLQGGAGSWTLCEPEIDAGTYRLYLYFADSTGTIVYMTAVPAAVWNGMTTDRWIRTENTPYLTDSGSFILTRDIIEEFMTCVGPVVYVSETGYGESGAAEPVHSLSQALAVLDGRDGTIIVDGDIAVTEEAVITQTVTVQGADCGGTLVNENGRVFVVEPGGSLTLDAGITLTGITARREKIEGHFAMVPTTETAGGSGGGAVYVNGGALIMKDCGMITKSTSHSGGAVLVENGGVFTMEGGVISGSKATTGGGVCVTGGSIFAMTGGVIEGMYADTGGGVHVGHGSMFTMSGGTICANGVNMRGGGVEAYGTFMMEGGTICANKARIGGGGVNVYGPFTMTGGTICANSVNMNGGGVVVGVDGTFTMSGGEVIGNNPANIAQDSGYGEVYITGGVFCDGRITSVSYDGWAGN